MTDIRSKSAYLPAKSVEELTRVIKTAPKNTEGEVLNRAHMLSDETKHALAQLKINPNKIPYRSVVGNSERHVDRNCRGELADTSHLVYLTGNGLLHGESSTHRIAKNRFFTIPQGVEHHTTGSTQEKLILGPVNSKGEHVHIDKKILTHHSSTRGYSVWKNSDHAPVDGTQLGGSKRRKHSRRQSKRKITKRKMTRKNSKSRRSSRRRR